VLKETSRELLPRRGSKFLYWSVTRRRRRSGSEAQDGLGGVFFTRSETTTVHLKQEDSNEKAGALFAIDKKDGATERADG
jgi:hypothetical protein